MIRWYFILRVQSLAALMTADAPVPKMIFSAEMYEFKNSSVLHFKCETNAMFEGCTVNFLKNDTSEQSIRYDNNKCYYISVYDRGICDPDKCTCSCCHTFYWNYTVNNDSNMENTSFECEGKIYENQQRFEASFVLQLIQKKFVFLKKNITPYGRRQPIQGLPVINNYTSTITPKLKVNDDPVNISYSILAIVALIAVMFVVFVVVYIKHYYYHDTANTNPPPAEGNTADTANTNPPQVQENTDYTGDTITTQAEGHTAKGNINVAEGITEKPHTETDTGQHRTPASARDSKYHELQHLLPATDKANK